MRNCSMHLGNSYLKSLLMIATFACILLVFISTSASDGKHLGAVIRLLRIIDFFFFF